jgi:hypothetical protein
MSHHSSGPDWGSPMGTPAWTSPICMPSRSQGTLASLEVPTIEAAKAAHSSASGTCVRRQRLQDRFQDHCRIFNRPLATTDPIPSAFKENSHDDVDV